MWYVGERVPLMNACVSVYVVPNHNILSENLSAE